MRFSGAGALMNDYTGDSYAYVSLMERLRGEE
jgi:hypothetical protein